MSLHRRRLMAGCEEMSSAACVRVMPTLEDGPKSVVLCPLADLFGFSLPSVTLPRKQRPERLMAQAPAIVVMSKPYHPPGPSEATNGLGEQFRS